MKDQIMKDRIIRWVKGLVRVADWLIPPVLSPLARRIREEREEKELEELRYLL